MSSAISEGRNLFSKFDKSHTGVISRKDFEEGYRLFFKDADERLPNILERMDPDDSGKIDYVTWSKFLGPADLPRIVSSCRKAGPLFRSTPTGKELELIHVMYNRINKVAKEAARTGTRLLIDAEQTYFQPAIDNITQNLQQRYNNIDMSPEGPIIFGTHQCYLQSTPQKIQHDVERALRFKYHFATKLVRGAYMIGERIRALHMGYPSPIFETKAATDACFNQSLEYILSQRVLQNTKSEIMLGTHNSDSVKLAMKLLNDLEISSSETIYFAQLLGMSDHLASLVMTNGHIVYKYMPYGKVDEVIPYLLRRAQENSDIFSESSDDIYCMSKELLQRIN
eukprot:CAMPEP_0113301674 /NCGR_PEP_ID=MMETSP0010_2-20120614/2802_1 /TAXON_ID=216773 ORGANISM="Corethron hystrix, Strain 308" /NCGR_SAMPLE_ID=MMETSP0010_2 /ASSEMBLY_ACC=CAM_ASM_000155 /LENGTH=338 /DNA_ID=CAMNT_0000155331 /DNA_START=1128 /DNA_END=2144 /DNA_ORIENTATION=- /assembly_acc=CAM_ASM_000155